MAAYGARARSAAMAAIADVLIFSGFMIHLAKLSLIIIKTNAGLSNRHAHPEKKIEPDRQQRHCARRPGTANPLPDSVLRDP
jgi:hypothetical protein